MKKRTYEVPVIVQVTVEIVGDGYLITDVHADNECAPWTESTRPTAYHLEEEKWHDDMDDEEREIADSAWDAAYEQIDKFLVSAPSLGVRIVEE